MQDDSLYIGRYEVLQVLGRGGMGVVYKARDPGIQRLVALKTVRLGMFDGEEEQELLERFKQEAQAVGRLTHPNIVQVFEYNEDEGKPFIAMEFVEGRELGEIMAEAPGVDLPTTIDLLDQMLSALAYVHTHGVVHRDLKPPNVLVLGDGTLKIMDFGIAKLESSQLTRTGAVMGTPSYMSPEQFTGQQIDARSDLFSAGVMLYELLTGEKPFPGKTMPAIMTRVVRAEFEFPTTINPTLNQSWDRLLARALAREPAQRFQNADEFADALHLAAADAYFDDILEAGEAETLLHANSDGLTRLQPRPRGGRSDGGGQAPARAGSSNPTSRRAADRQRSRIDRSTRRETAAMQSGAAPSVALDGAADEQQHIGTVVEREPAAARSGRGGWMALVGLLVIGAAGGGAWFMGLVPPGLLPEPAQTVPAGPGEAFSGTDANAGVGSVTVAAPVAGPVAVPGPAGLASPQARPAGPATVDTSAQAPAGSDRPDVRDLPPVSDAAAGTASTGADPFVPATQIPPATRIPPVKVTDLQAGRIEMTTTPLEGSYYGLIDATSVPVGALVYIDDVEFGETPLKFDVPPGVYQIRVEKEGFEPQESTVNMETGTQVKVEVRLSEL